MTTELEKQFFDTFEIEPRLDCKRCGAKDFALGQCWEVDCEKTYPQITDRILLELICILNSYGKNDTWAVSVKKLKDFILMNCIKVIKENYLNEMPLNNFKQQVQALFKE